MGGVETRQFCIILGDKAFFVSNFQIQSKTFQGFHPKYAGLYGPQSTPSLVSLAFLWDSPITLNEKLV